MTVEENVYNDVCKVKNIRNHIVCDKDINITTTNKTIDRNESTKTGSIDSTSDNENGSTVLIILILILIVIMALIGIGFYIIAKRRKKREFLNHILSKKEPKVKENSSQAKSL